MINPFRHRRILKSGIPAEAEVTQMSPLPPRGQHSFVVNLAMTLRVHLEGLDAYAVEDQWLVKPREANCLTAGSIPVKVDPRNHENVAIDWPSARERYERLQKKLSRGGFHQNVSSV